MFTPRFPAIVLPLGGPGEATRKAPEVDIQLKNLRSVGDGTGNFCVGRELQGERGEGGPARVCGWILLRGWTKDALNLAKSGCKVAVNSR